MGANFSRIKTWVVEVLTKSDLNAEFDNVLNNFDPDGCDDASASSTAMQATADPYPGSVASLATSLRGELQRIRYILNQLGYGTYWYVDPAVWTTPTFDAANFAATGGGTWVVASGDVTTYSYTIVGKIMHIVWNIATSTVTTPATSLTIKIPASKIALEDSRGFCISTDNGGTQSAGVYTIADGGTVINCYSTAAGGAWAAATNTTSVQGTATLGIE